MRPSSHRLAVITAAAALAAVGGGAAFAASTSESNGEAPRPATETGQTVRSLQVVEEDTGGSDAVDEEANTHGPKGCGRGLAVVLGSAAEYLQIERAELRERLAEGASLAEIAEETPGKSTDGLKAALRDTLTAKLGALELTDEQRAAKLEAIDSRLDRLIARDGLRSDRKRGHGKRWGPKRGLAVVLGSAAEYLQIERAELRERLAEGASLAEIAEETPGKSTDGSRPRSATRSPPSLAHSSSPTNSGRPSSKRSTRASTA